MDLQSGKRVIDGLDHKRAWSVNSPDFLPESISSSCFWLLREPPAKLGTNLASL